MKSSQIAIVVIGIAALGILIWYLFNQSQDQNQQSSGGGGLFGGLGDLGNLFGQGISSLGSDISNGIKNLENDFSQVGKFVSNSANSALKDYENLVNQEIQTAGNIGKGISSGLQTAGKGVENSVNGFYQQAAQHTEQLAKASGALLNSARTDLMQLPHFTPAVFAPVEKDFQTAWTGFVNLFNQKSKNSKHPYYR